MSTASRSTSSDDPLFTSYIALANALVGELAGICLLNGLLQSRGHSGDLQVEAVKSWIQSLGWNDLDERLPAARAQPSKRCWVAIPIEQTDGTLLGPRRPPSPRGMPGISGSGSNRSSTASTAISRPPFRPEANSRS